MNYPQTTGYVANSATSKASAEQLDKSGNAASQAGAILACLKRLGVTGAAFERLAQMASINTKREAIWRDRLYQERQSNLAVREHLDKIMESLVNLESVKLPALTTTKESV